MAPSTYLLIGLVGIEFGSLLRTALKWAIGAWAVFPVCRTVCQGHCRASRQHDHRH
jgi:Mg2+/citrate symporter